MGGINSYWGHQKGNLAKNEEPWGVQRHGAVFPIKSIKNPVDEGRLAIAFSNQSGLAQMTFPLQYG
jgi:hypothetical protein